MVMGIRVFLLAAVFAASGCESGAPREAPKAAPASSIAHATPAAPIAAAPSNKFGAPLGNSPVVPLADIMHSSSKYARTTVKTEGKVTAVCQAAGCWMEISDSNGGAHVRMSGHSFLVPKSAAGRRAIVEGTVLPKPDNGECEQEALEATGKTVKVELDATGVELL
jgi:hypothetical protein